MVVVVVIVVDSLHDGQLSLAERLLIKGHTMTKPSGTLLKSSFCGLAATSSTFLQRAQKSEVSKLAANANISTFTLKNNLPSLVKAPPSYKANKTLF